MDRRRRPYVPGAEGLEGRMVLSTVAAPPVASAAMIASPVTAQTTRPVVSTDSEAVLQQTIARVRADIESRAPRALSARQEAAIPQWIETRFQRIDRLPAFLQSLDRGRVLPGEAIATLQREIRGFVAALHAPAEPVATAFVEVLRDAASVGSVRESSVNQLDNALSRLLQSAGADSTSIQQIRGAMDDLARTAVISENPVVVLTNDYALVLQTILGVGRPIGIGELALV